MTMTRFKLWMSVLVVLGLILAVASVFAQSKQPKDQHYLTYRQKLMASIGANMGAIGVSLKTGLPSKANIGVHAEAMHNASKLIEGAFKQEIIEGKTDIKPDAYKKWDEFVAAAKKLTEESGKLVSAAKAGDDAELGAQLKATGKSCGGCHKPFRKPKEERFKR